MDYYWLRWYDYGYRWYDPMKGRWVSRYAIGERGGVNPNAPDRIGFINSVDVKGKFAFVPWMVYTAIGAGAAYVGGCKATEPSDTIEVSKCEIVIAAGHGSQSNPLKWKFPASGCAAGAAATCWPASNRNGTSIPPKNSLPGSPTHNDTVIVGNPIDVGVCGTNPGAGGDMSLINKNFEDDLENYGPESAKSKDRNFNRILHTLLHSAFRKAIKMCKCCSSGVVIRTKSLAPSVMSPKRWWDNVPEHEFRYDFRCPDPDGSANNADFKEAIRQFDRQWRNSE